MVAGEWFTHIYLLQNAGIGLLPLMFFSTLEFSSHYWNSKTAQRFTVAVWGWQVCSDQTVGSYQIHEMYLHHFGMTDCLSNSTCTYKISKVSLDMSTSLCSYCHRTVTGKCGGTEFQLPFCSKYRTKNSLWNLLYLALVMDFQPLRTWGFLGPIVLIHLFSLYKCKKI